MAGKKDDQKPEKQSLRVAAKKSVFFWEISKIVKASKGIQISRKRRHRMFEAKPENSLIYVLIFLCLLEPYTFSSFFIFSAYKLNFTAE